MTERIQRFLLVFDHQHGKLIQIEQFGEDSDTAVAAYAAREAEFDEARHIEVVLVGSDSIDTVRLTHANYVEAVSVSKYLAGI